MMLFKAFVVKPVNLMKYLRIVLSTYKHKEFYSVACMHNN